MSVSIHARNALTNAMISFYAPDPLHHSLLEIKCAMDSGTAYIDNCKVLVLGNGKSDQTAVSMLSLSMYVYTYIHTLTLPKPEKLRIMVLS